MSLVFAVLLAADTVAFFLIDVLFPFWVVPCGFFFSFFGPDNDFVRIGDKLIDVLVALFGMSPSSIGVDIPCCGPGSSVVAFRLRVAWLPSFSCWTVSFTVVFGL